MLVLGECGRALAAVPLLGHLPATAILNEAASGLGETSLLEELASGERRAAYLAARPPDDISGHWSVDPAGGMERPALPAAMRGGDGRGTCERAARICARRPRCRRAGGRRPDRRRSGWLCGGVHRGRRICRGGAPLRRNPSARSRDAAGYARHDPRRARQRTRRGVAPCASADRGGVTWRGGERARHVGGVRQGALYLRACDRLLPSGEALAHRGAAPAGERPLAALLRRLVAPRGARGVRLGRQRRTLGSGPRAGSRGPHDDLGARRDRRHLGARRARCTFAAPSSLAACWAAPRLRPIGSRAS